MSKKPLTVAHSPKQHSLLSVIEHVLGQIVPLAEEPEMDILIRHKGSVRTVQVSLAATEPPKRPKYRIRRCNGNRDAWMIAALREDGSEIDSYGGWTTAYSIDALVKGTPGNSHLVPKPGEIVEFMP